MNIKMITNPIAYENTYFLSNDEFEKQIVNDDFVEYEEVYSGCYYGTLRSEIERISSQGKIVVFDVDVVGGLNLKKKFGADALALFIAPPSIQSLRERLINRQTDTPEMIDKRVDFPQPLGPTILTNSPCLTLKLTSFKAGTSPFGA